MIKKTARMHIIVLMPNLSAINPKGGANIIKNKGFSCEEMLNIVALSDFSICSSTSSTKIGFLMLNSA